MAPATLDWTQPLDDSYGVVFFGILVSAVLHGCCIVQAFTYFQQCRNDKWIVKTIVVTTVLVDGIHLILISVGLYDYLIQSFHKPERLEYLSPFELMEALCVGTNAAIVQIYYTYRIFKLTNKRNYVLCCFVLFMILGEVASGITWVVLTMQMKTWRELLKVAPVTIAIDALSCFIDVVIAGSLVWILQSSRTGFKRSDTIINKLTVFVINTGIVFSVSSLIAVIVAPEKMIYAAIYFCIGRLYTNSLLTTLNSRAQIAKSMETELQVTSNISPRGTTTSGMRNLNILVETTTQEAIHEMEKPTNLLGFKSDQSTTYPDLKPKHHSQSQGYAW